MKLQLIGHDEKYAVEQSLLTLFPDERPVYGEVDETADDIWAVVRLEETENTVCVTTELCCAQKRGSYRYDDFKREMVLMVNDIMEAQKPVREDNAPEKRVELHLHTKMSNMDALTDTKEVIKQAISWEHPAIAITDHGYTHVVFGLRRRKIEKRYL